MDQLSDSDFVVRVILFIMVVTLGAQWIWIRIQTNRKKNLPYRPLKVVNKRKTA